MEAIITREDDRVTVHIMGRLDTVTSEELKKQLAEADIAGCDILLDFADMEYISSAGLRLLVALQKQAASTGHKLAVTNLNRVVQEIFKVAGFSKAIHVI